MSETQIQYDALLVLSFGGPEGMDDVLPFLENVLRGRNVPRERMMEVGEHYKLFDGVSPINSQNRALIAALEEELKAHDINLPIYWGNRNWEPYLTDTMQQMTDDGVKRALVFFTSAYSCYSGCRQYRENIMDAQVVVGENAPEFHLLRKFYNHPGFVEPNAENVRAALDQIPEDRRANVHIAFTAHSIPMGQANNSQYEAQLTETSRLVAEELGVTNWKLVYQSRSGHPSHPWLEPDILDHMQALYDDDVREMVIAPVGFISDHMEVIYDLDTEAAQLADELGMTMVRAATVGTHSTFISMIRELVQERLSDDVERRAVGSRGPSYDFCPANCCLPGERPGRPTQKPEVAAASR